MFELKTRETKLTATRTERTFVDIMRKERELNY